MVKPKLFKPPGLVYVVVDRYGSPFGGPFHDKEQAFAYLGDEDGALVSGFRVYAYEKLGKVTL